MHVELALIYDKRGLDPKFAAQVADQLVKRHFDMQAYPIEVAVRNEITIVLNGFNRAADESIVYMGVSLGC